jgi:flavin-dependent dehydrogenase
LYDVVIIGARCTGSALALMLARDGLNVLAIDRTTFPSDTMSGHFIQPEIAGRADVAALIFPG